LDEADPISGLSPQTTSITIRNPKSVALDANGQATLMDGKQIPGSSDEIAREIQDRTRREADVSCTLSVNPKLIPASRTLDLSSLGKLVLVKSLAQTTESDGWALTRRECQINSSHYDNIKEVDLWFRQSGDHQEVATRLSCRNEGKTKKVKKFLITLCSGVYDSMSLDRIEQALGVDLTIQSEPLDVAALSALSTAPANSRSAQSSQSEVKRLPIETTAIAPATVSAIQALSGN
jgi:hypothetical protein